MTRPNIRIHIGKRAVFALSAGLGVVVAGSLAASAMRNSAADASPAGPMPPAVTYSDQLLLDHAEQILTRDCMRRAGFRFWVTRPVASPVANTFPYVISDFKWAHDNGYGSRIPSLIVKARATNPNGRYVQGLARGRRGAYLSDLNGPGPSAPQVRVTLPGGEVVGHNTSGCTKEADETLYGDYRSWFPGHTVTEYLAPTWQAQVRADPAYLDAATAWRRCMRGRNHHYSDPIQARAAFLKSPRPIGTFGAEVRTAEDEARCATTSHLATTAQRLDAAYADRLPKKYRGLIHTSRQMALDALGRASAIVRRG